MSKIWDNTRLGGRSCYMDHGCHAKFSLWSNAMRMHQGILGKEVEYPFRMDHKTHSEKITVSEKIEVDGSLGQGFGKLWPGDQI